ncbi:hypothetical protein F4814DRAFT_460586 [Daldinia grandis]|nr:hypothetical protein F4814DRAFT_460586 [Daldinia grandis]
MVRIPLPDPERMPIYPIVGIDMVPNITAYPEEWLFDTSFTLPNGKPAQFYTNDCEGVVDLHFNMMANYGISGAFIQRFYGYINEANGGWVNIRKLLPYNLIASLYASQREACPGDMGFGIVTEVTVDDGIVIVTALRNAGWYVILGVQQAWHAELVVDQRGGFGPVYKLAHMIQPWTVGAYDIDNYDEFHDGRQAVEDRNALQQLGLESSIVVWPGGSSRSCLLINVF